MKCFSRYNYMWPKGNLATYLVCVKPEQKDVLYILLQERATPAYMQATSSVKCKKKNTVRSMSLILSYLQISPKKKEFS